jgi:D-alanyl-lipoteichoic acid acyltransferase DltB (MBOAT superfamily)
MERNVIIGAVPWPVAALAAIWFGVMAYKAGKNAVLWGIGGGMLALIVTTTIMGLGQAAFIPFTSADQSMFRIKIGALAIFVVFCLGWLFTGSLHPHLLAPWKRRSETPKEPAPAPPTKPTGTSPQV